jgi:hypothetical protein
MTDYSPRLPRLALIIALLILAVFLWMLMGCNSQKHITRTSVTVDSTAIREKMDSIRMLTREVGRLEADIRELQYAGVVFIRDTISRVDTVTNTVTITKDGSIEAKGRIASAFVSKETMARITYQLQREKDSLATALQKEKQNVKKEQVVREVEKQVRFLPWFYWPLIIASFAFGAVVAWRAKRKLFI